MNGNGTHTHTQSTNGSPFIDLRIYFTNPWSLNLLVLFRLRFAGRKHTHTACKFVVGHAHKQSHTTELAPGTTLSIDVARHGTQLRTTPVANF
jgi:hypothetical protein